MTTNAFIATRRSVLSVGASTLALPALAAAQAVGTDNPDAAILSAWARWQASHARFEASPMGGLPGERLDDLGLTAAERACFDTMDETADAIGQAIAKTPRGAEAMLWLALEHIAHGLGGAAHRAAVNGDLAHFNGLADLEQDARMILAGIRSLRSMAA